METMQKDTAECIQDLRSELIGHDGPDIGSRLVDVLDRMLELLIEIDEKVEVVKRLQMFG